jgi:hypothetical protein
LASEFKQSRQDKAITAQVRCAFEVRTTFGVQIVDRWSGTRFCDGASLGVDADHLEIVKPEDENHISFKALANAYRETSTATSPDAKAASQPIAQAQRVRWSPDNGGPVGIDVIAPAYEFIPWDRLEREIQFKILNRVHVPYGSTARVEAMPSTGQPNMIVAIYSPDNLKLAHIWFGGDPLKNWAHDGKVRVGMPERQNGAVEIWKTFERHTDGSYIQIE